MGHIFIIDVPRFFYNSKDLWLRFKYLLNLDTIVLKDSLIHFFSGIFVHIYGMFVLVKIFPRMAKTYCSYNLSSYLFYFVSFFTSFDFQNYTFHNSISYYHLLKYFMFQMLHFLVKEPLDMC